MDLKEKEKKRQPFVAKINEQSLDKAKMYTLKQKELAQRRGNMNSLEYEALNDQLLDENEDGVDEMGFNQNGESGLDILGEAENSMDDIQAKMENE